MYRRCLQIAPGRQIIAGELHQTSRTGTIGDPHQRRRDSRVHRDLQHILMQRRRTSQELRLSPTLEFDQARDIVGTCLRRGEVILLYRRQCAFDDLLVRGPGF